MAISSAEGSIYVGGGKFRNVGLLLYQDTKKCILQYFQLSDRIIFVKLNANAVNIRICICTDSANHGGINCVLLRTGQRQSAMQIVEIRNIMGGEEHKSR